MSSAAVEGLSGALGASISLLLTYPLQTISTRQATKRKSEQDDEQRKDSYSTVNGQIGSYYWGIRPALVGTVASQGLYFYFYATLRKAVQERSSQARQEGLSVPQSLAVASLAGSLNVLATNPIWLAVTRMQTAAASRHGRTSFFREVQTLYDEGGIPALWRGTLPSLVMVVNPTIQYALYELGTRLWRQRQARLSAPAAKLHSLTSLEIFAVASLAKLGATLLTYPLLVVKNRTQAARKDGTNRSRDCVAIVRQVWQQQGCLGFFRGMRAKIVQSVLAAALMFVLKERLNQITLRAVKRLA